MPYSVDYMVLSVEKKNRFILLYLVKSKFVSNKKLSLCVAMYFFLVLLQSYSSSNLYKNIEVAFVYDALYMMQMLNNKFGVSIVIFYLFIYLFIYFLCYDGTSCTQTKNC